MQLPSNWWNQVLCCDLNTSQGDIPFTITIGQMLSWVMDDENKLTGWRLCFD
jgi:hypothetical protein